MVITIGTMHFTLNLFQPWLSPYLQALGAPIEIISLIAVLQGILGMIFQFPGGILTDRIGRKKIILLGSFFRVITYIIFMLAQTWQVIILGQITKAMAMVYSPSITSLSLESMPKKRTAFGMGFISLSILIAATIANPIGGIILDTYNVINGTKLILTINVY